MRGQLAGGVTGVTVMVTGATGFIGTHLVARLAALDARVHAVSRRSASADSAERVHWWRCDLTDETQVRSLVREVEPDVIVHLASEVAGARDHQLVLPMMRANLASTVHLLSAAVERPGTRLVLAGSMEEPDPGSAPSSPYVAAKAAATGYTRMFRDLWLLRVTTLRIAMVYGPGQRDSTKLLPYAITCLLRGHSPRMTTGRRPVDWVYVGDVVDAFVAAVSRPDIDEVLEIGSGTAVTIRDAVDRLTDVIGGDVRPRYGALADRPLDSARIADPTRAEEAIGWRATTSLDEGLARTVEWFRRQ
jgi:nucleoside-diphosphate-sugar epimerase